MTELEDWLGQIVQAISEGVKLVDDRQQLGPIIGFTLGLGLMARHPEYAQLVQRELGGKIVTDLSAFDRTADLMVEHYPSPLVKDPA